MKKSKRYFVGFMATLLSLCMLTGCQNKETLTAVLDNTLYDVKEKGMLPCYINNGGMLVEEFVFDSDSLRGYANDYIFEVMDEDIFILLCNVENVRLQEKEAADARDLLKDYFKDTAISLDLSQLSAKYMKTKDISPASGKDADFYKFIFDGAGITVDGVEMTGSVALLNYENRYIACIIGSKDGGFSDGEILNMMRSVGFMDSEDLSTGDSSKPSYKVPDGLISERSSTGQAYREDRDEKNDTDDRSDRDDRDNKNNRKYAKNRKDEELDADADYENIDYANEDDNDLNESAFTRTFDDVDADDILSKTVYVEGMRLSLPATYDDFVELGLTPDEDRDLEVEGNGIAVVYFTTPKGSEIEVDFNNPDSDTALLKDCPAEYICIEADEVRDPSDIIIGDSIVLGFTTVKDILDGADREYDYAYGSKGDATINYSDFIGDYYLSCTYRFIDQALDEITIYYSND